MQEEQEHATDLHTIEAAMNNVALATAAEDAEQEAGMSEATTEVAEAATMTDGTETQKAVGGGNPGTPAEADAEAIDGVEPVEPVDS